MDDADNNRPSQHESSGQVVSGVLLAILGTFLFALKSIFIKLAFAAGTEATVLLTIRMLFAVPFYVAVLQFGNPDSRQKPLTRKDIVQALSLGFLGYYLASWLDLSGLEFISAQLERLTLFTYPALVAVLAWLFLGEQLTPRIIAAITLSYLGVFLMYGQERAFADGSNTGLGVLLVMGSALSYSLYILFAKPAMLLIGSRRFTSLAMIGSTCFVCTHFLYTRRPATLLEISPTVCGYGLILAFVCTVIPSFMVNEAIVRIGATRTTVIGAIGPVLTMALAILVLDEPSSVQHFVGMGIAVFGVSLVVRRQPQNDANRSTGTLAAVPAKSPAD